MSQFAVLRRFFVHDADAAGPCVREIEGAGFEDAAFAFIEDAHPGAEADEVAVIVEDCETGERQCFRVELGDATAWDLANQDAPPATDRFRAAASR